MSKIWATMSSGVCELPMPSFRLWTCLGLNIEGWAQDWRKSDGCFSPNLISSPWRRYEDYNISFCKQWKLRCHCSYEQWHLNLHCLQRGPSCPETRVSKICLSYHSLALNPRYVFWHYDMLTFVQIIFSLSTPSSSNELFHHLNSIIWMNPLSQA